MTTLRKTPSIGSLIAVALLVATAWNFSGPLIGSYLGQVNRNNAAFATARAGVVESHNRNYKSLCPRWRDATLLERWTTYGDRRWCKDFVGRL